MSIRKRSVIVLRIERLFRLAGVEDARRGGLRPRRQPRGRCFQRRTASLVRFACTMVLWQALRAYQRRAASTRAAQICALSVASGSSGACGSWEKPRGAVRTCRRKRSRRRACAGIDFGSAASWCSRCSQTARRTRSSGREPEIQGRVQADMRAGRSGRARRRRHGDHESIAVEQVSRRQSA